MTRTVVTSELLDEDLEEAYEYGPVGYVSALPDGTIVRVNQTFLSWTGYAREDIVRRRKLQELFAVAGRIYYETHLGPLLAMQGALNEIALDLVRRDGASLPVMINASQKRTGSGAPLLNRFSVFNATDRRRYEQQLLEARRQAQAVAQAKTELLAMLSHDIRTPLGTVLAVAQILERTPLTPEQKSAVRILHSSGTAMLALVNQILEHGRIEAGAVTVEEAPLDLRALVRELHEDFELLARNKGVALEALVDERVPPRVLGDATKLGQILGNLLGNALKFTERGCVTLELRVLGHESGTVRLRVVVRDTGIGISEDALPRIFEEYGQAHDNIAKRYGGTGLGLAIVRKLLKALGSELQVQSTVGVGSEFSFELAMPCPAG